MKNLLIAFLLITGFAFIGCTSTHQKNNLNDLSSAEIEAYNNNPNNTDKIVCRTETPIGSRLPKRVCHMESTISDRSQQDQRAIEAIQTRGNIGTRKGGG